MRRQEEPITPPPLPELQQQDLDEATVRALFRDVAALGEGVEVLVKGAPVARAEALALAPEAALEGLLAGRWRAVQLRYGHEGQVWLDTVLRTPQGFRVVRMLQAPVP